MQIRITPPSAPHVRLARRTPVARNPSARARSPAFRSALNALFTNEYMGVTKALPWGHFSREAETPQEVTEGVVEMTGKIGPPRNVRVNTLTRTTDWSSATGREP